MEKHILQQYQEYCRYLRPYESIAFSDREMLSCMLRHVDPDDVASITQLLGDRRGVIRVTLKNNIGLQKLETLVKQRQLVLKGMTLGLVEEQGFFHIVTLDNVPNFISEEQVEEVMGQFGVIAGTLRDHVEYRGKKVETEKRRVLFTTLNNVHALPKEIEICGISVFLRAKVRSQKGEEGDGRRSSNGRRTPSENGSGSSRRNLALTRLNEGLED